MPNHEIVKLDDTFIVQMMAIEQSCHSHPWSEKLMLSCLSGRYCAFGVVAQETLIAFYIVEQAGPDFTLMDICVHPEQQGRGFAKLLLNHLRDYVMQQGGEIIFLEVRESNVNAISLYLVAGFKKSGIRKNYYPAESGREHAILMMLPMT